MFLQPFSSFYSYSYILLNIHSCSLLSIHFYLTYYNISLITYNNQNFIKSKIKTCDIITSPVTFPVGTTLEEALEICSQETELGGHGQCIGILPFNKRNKMYAGDDTIYPWIGCLSTSYYDDCENSIVEGTWLNIDNEDVNNYMWA